MHQEVTPTEEKTVRRRKTQAVMAGGVVLGIGAIVTLAAWNDSEFADGLFGSGAFNLEGSVDGQSYQDHPSEGAAATLNFSADNMIPGETVYAPFSVRLDSSTTVAGTVEEADGIQITNSTGENVENLSYSVYANPDTCDAGGATTGDEVAGGADLSEGIGSSSTIQLSSGGNGDPGDPVLLCFVVTADNEDLEQAASTEAVWQITATSLEG